MPQFQQSCIFYGCQNFSCHERHFVFGHFWNSLNYFRLLGVTPESVNTHLLPSSTFVESSTWSATFDKWFRRDQQIVHSATCRRRSSVVGGSSGASYQNIRGVKSLSSALRSVLSFIHCSDTEDFEAQFNQCCCRVDACRRFWSTLNIE